MPTSVGPHLHRLISATIGDSFGAEFRAFLRMVEELVQCAVISKTLSAPPGSPANGDRYIVGPSPTGFWSGAANYIAAWTTDDPATPLGYWDYFPPNAGFMVYCVADSTIYVFNGTSWGPLSAGSVFGASGGSHASGLVPDPGGSAGTSKFLREDATFQVPPAPPTMVASGASHAGGSVPDPGVTAGTTKFLREDATFAVPPAGTSSSTFVASGASHAGGLVPDPGSVAGATKYLREDATFQVPPVPVTMVASGGSHAGGLVPDPGASAGTTKFLREDATFAVPAGGGGSGPACQTRKKYGRVTSSYGSTGPTFEGDNFTPMNVSAWNAFAAASANAGGRTEYKSTSGVIDAAYGWSGDPLYRTGRHIELWGAIYFPGITDCAHWFAMTNDTTVTFGNSDTNASANFAGFRFSTMAGDSHWQAITGDGSATTVTDTGITPDGKEHRFAIFFDDDNAKVLFYIDGVLVATNTTHLPSASTNLNYYLSTRKHVTAPTGSHLIAFGQIVASADF